MSFGNPFILRQSSKHRGSYEVLDVNGEWSGEAFRSVPHDRDGKTVPGANPLYYITFKVPWQKVQVAK